MLEVLFKDREDAANKLLEVMPSDIIKNEICAMVCVSSGGLSIASYLKRRNKMKLHFLLSASIFAPQNPDCEIARVSETEEIVINNALLNAFDIKLDYIYGEASRKHEEKILSAMYQYRKGRHFESMKDKTVMLVDEGSETGLKFMCALKTILVMKPKAVYVAVPVLPKEIVDALEPLVDGLFFVHELNDYSFTASYYGSFDLIDDEQIETILGEEI